MINTMRKIVIGLVLWNLLLTGFVIIDKAIQYEDKQNQTICNLESIPLEDLEVLDE